MIEIESNFSDIRKYSFEGIIEKDTNQRENIINKINLNKQIIFQNLFHIKSTKLVDDDLLWIRISEKQIMARFTGHFNMGVWENGIA
jgi:hypothetical protein